MLRIIFYSTLLIALCVSENENCKWTYRCCKFKEINGVLECEEMCNAVINCESKISSTSSEVESFNDTLSEKSEKFLYSFRRRMPVPMCRSGFKHMNGQCRRVLGGS